MNINDLICGIRSSRSLERNPLVLSDAGIHDLLRYFFLDGLLLGLDTKSVGDEHRLRQREEPVCVCTQRHSRVKSIVISHRPTSA